MKKLVLLLLFSIGISYVYAGKFKVLFVNDASLKYTNGKVVKVGDTFKSAEDINWQKDKQAIKVFDAKVVSTHWYHKSAFLPTRQLDCQKTRKTPLWISSRTSTCYLTPLRFLSRRVLYWMRTTTLRPLTTMVTPA